MRGTVDDVIRKVKGLEPIDPMDEELLDLMDDGSVEARQILDIEAAFAGGEFHGDRIVDDPLDAESADLAAAVRGKRWREVPVDAIIDNRYGLPFFSAEAFRYYFPAFLIAALAYPIATDVLPLSAYSNLCPPEDNPRLMPWFLERVTGFNASQRKVLRAYVERYNRLDERYPKPRHKWAADFWQERTRSGT